MSRQVAVVDDDEALREALAWLLTHHGFITETYASGESLLALAPTQFSEIGCLVLDVRLSGMSGLVLFEQLLDRPDYCPPVLFLTGHADVPLAVTALKMGAVDFLEKPFDDEKLLNHVQDCLARDTAERVRFEKRHETNAALALLTDREREVMALVVEGKLNKQIAEALDISIKTVEVHRARVLEKMGVKSAIELAGRLARNQAAS